MDKKQLASIKAQAQKVEQSMQTDSTAPGNPTAISALAHALVRLIEIMEKGDDD